MSILPAHKITQKSIQNSAQNRKGLLNCVPDLLLGPRLQLLQVVRRLLLRLEASHDLVHVGHARRLLHAAERLLVRVVLDVVSLRGRAVAVLRGPPVLLGGRGVRVVGGGDGFAASLLRGKGETS